MRPRSSTITWSARPFGLEQEVRAHEDGLALLGELVDEAEHGLGRLGVEAGGRLVEQQQVGLVEHGAGEREAGPHAGGVAADPLVERVARCRSAPRPRRCGRRGPRRVDLEQLAGVAQVVVPAEPVVERGAGRHHAAAPADVGAVGAASARSRRRGPSPASGAQRAGHEADDGRLAGAVGAEQHGDRCRRGTSSVEAVDRDDLPERPPHAAGRDCRARTRVACHAGGIGQNRPE